MTNGVDDMGVLRHRVMGSLFTGICAPSKHHCGSCRTADTARDGPCCAPSLDQSGQTAAVQIGGYVRASVTLEPRPLAWRRFLQVVHTARLSARPTLAAR
jgi:hypothetical protein